MRVEARASLGMWWYLGIAVEMGEAARGAQIKRGTTETETAKTPEPGSMPERKLKPERSSRSCARPGRTVVHNGDANRWRELGALLLMEAVMPPRRRLRASPFFGRIRHHRGAGVGA